MGCDIHTHVEIKQVTKGKEKWNCADYFKLNRYFDPNDNDWGSKHEIVGICNDRNYSLFSVLADVRNYGDTESICQPKGIPEDCCNEIKEDYQFWGEDAHSASYFTLKELMEWQKTAPPLKHSGMISSEASKALDNGEIPQSWCQWTNRSGYVERTWEEKNEVLVPLIDALIQRGKELYFWYTEEQIQEGAEKMRFVFWFDN